MSDHINLDSEDLEGLEFGSLDVIANHFNDTLEHAQIVYQSNISNDSEEAVTEEMLIEEVANEEMETENMQSSIKVEKGATFETSENKSDLKDEILINEAGELYTTVEAQEEGAIEERVYIDHAGNNVILSQADLEESTVFESVQEENSEPEEMVEEIEQFSDHYNIGDDNDSVEINSEDLIVEEVQDDTIQIEELRMVKQNQPMQIVIKRPTGGSIVRRETLMRSGLDGASGNVIIVSKEDVAKVKQPSMQKSILKTVKNSAFTRLLQPSIKTITSQPTTSTPTIRIVTTSQPQAKYSILSSAMSTPKAKLISSPAARTITLAQAQQMGLFTQAKINSVMPTIGTSTTNLVLSKQPPLFKKVIQIPKKNTIMTSVGIKQQPTKILPATKSIAKSLNSGSLILTREGTSKASTIKVIPNKTIVAQQAKSTFIPGQLFKMSNGKTVQYVKLLPNGSNTQYIKTVPVHAELTSLRHSTPNFKVIQSSVNSSKVFLTSISATKPSISKTYHKQVPKKITLVAETKKQIEVRKDHDEKEKAKSSILDEKMGDGKNEELSSKTLLQFDRDSKDSMKSLLSQNDLGKGRPDDSLSLVVDEAILEANGIRPRKPCNCTKSMCLKLYCDCFANGEFCYQCNCTCCFNNLDHEEERQRAIKSCLERNPAAFRPKIGGKSYTEERRHTKGCNCRRSGCLKNYCECYEAKIPCSRNCKCIGCRNTECIQSALNGSSHGLSATNWASRQIFGQLTHEVLKSLTKCLLARAEECEKAGSKEIGNSVVLEEFSSCLTQLVEVVQRTAITSQQLQHVQASHLPSTQITNT